MFEVIDTVENNIPVNILEMINNHINTIMNETIERIETS